MKPLVSVCLLFALSACTQPEPRPVAMPGADRDAHGCIGSAGYRWCTTTDQCERPWELAKARGLDNTASGFDAYCEAAPARNDGAKNPG